MKKTCDNCYYFYECDEEGDGILEYICQKFFANYSNEISSGGWYEMSWNQFTDDLLDYGEVSDWDEFVKEEDKF